MTEVRRIESRRPEKTEHSRVDDASARLRTELYNIRNRYESNVEGAFSELREVLNGYNIAESEVGTYLKRLEKDKAILYEEQLSQKERDKIIDEMVKDTSVIQDYVASREARHLEEAKKKEGERTRQLGLAAIIFLTAMSIGILLYTNTEPTARLVSPAVANLPLGITFLAILVIAIIAMPRLRR